MKPYLLTLQAFGPFEEQITVDFTRFNNSLFLITGKTGSGKSTIFDALMYALFGESSGEDRSPKEMRTQNISPRTKTIVRLEFEHNGSMYLIERTIPPNKSSTESVMLRYPDGRIVEKIRVVRAEIVSLLGVDANQFRMIAMLAQGKFLKLLTAENNEKSGILKKLFDTQIYALFQDKLKLKDSQLLAEHRAFEQKLNAEITHLKTPEDNPEYTWLTEFIKTPSIADSTLEDLFADLKKLAEDDTAHLQQINEQLTTVKAELTRIAEEKGKAESGNRMIAQADAARKKRDELLPQKEHFTALKTAVQRAHAAESVSAAETLYLNAHENRTGLETTIAENRKLIKETEPVYTNMSQKLADLENDPELKSMQKKRDLLTLSMDTYHKLATCEAERQHLSESISAAMELAAAIDTDIAEITGRIDASETQIQNLETVDVELNETKNQLTELSKKQDILTELDTVLDSLKSLDTSLQLKQLECRRAKEEYQKLHSLAEKQQQLYLDGQAGILADTLKDNTPCPVCGSLTHPSPATRSETVPERATVDKAQKSAENAQKIWTQKTTEAAACKSERTTTEEQLRKAAGAFVTVNGSIDEITSLLTAYAHTLETEKENLLKKKQDLTKRAGEKKRISETIPKLRTDLDAKQKEKSKVEQAYSADSGQLKKLEQTITDLIKTLPYPTEQEAKTACTELTRNLEQHETEITELRNRKEITQKSLNQATGIIQNATVQLDQARCKETETLAAYQTAREKNGFATAEEYRSALQDTRNLVSAESAVSKFFADLETAETELRISEENCQGRTYVELNTLTEHQTAYTAEETRLLTEQRCYLDRLDNNTKVTDEIKEIWQTSKSRNELYTAVHKLADTANGTINQKEKINLEYYIQGVYFSEILRFANKRLLTMSSNRYELIRAETAADKQAKSGLDITVIDRFTGKTRDVTTLSGGESFLAALALALGLSEMIQHLSGGISIDALFVDEGFDTLDTDALQDVLKVLWTLTTGNRVVGIISHRSELREQLDRKIIVTKLGNGRSRIDPKY